MKAAAACSRQTARAVAAIEVAKGVASMAMAKVEGEAGAAMALEAGLPPEPRVGAVEAVREEGGGKGPVANRMPQPAEGPRPVEKAGKVGMAARAQAYSAAAQAETTQSQSH